jgi:hypothetical protein
MTIVGRLFGRSRKKAHLARHSNLAPDDPLRFLELDKDGPVPTGLAYPDQSGWPIASGAEVVAAHERSVRQAYRAFDARAIMPNFDREFSTLLVNFASWVSLLPASRNYHHAKPGGLFAHSLEVATKCLHYSMGHIVTQDSLPRDREADKFAWALTAFLVGLLHDIGKIHTIGDVVAHNVAIDPASSAFRSSAAPEYRLVWRPEVVPQAVWMKTYRIKSVRIEFLDGKVDAHLQYIHPYFYRIVPTAMVSLIFNANPKISHMLDSYLKYPASASREAIFQIVTQADGESVRYDRDPRGLPGAIDMNALIIRRFLEFAAAQNIWNTPSSCFFKGYLENRVGSDRHYIELDFFVATMENVERFMHFLRGNDMFGVSLPANAEAAVFSALLGNGVLHSTIPGVLEQRRPHPDLPSYNPAAAATVRYVAESRPGVANSPTVHPIYSDPIVTQRPVLALGQPILDRHRDFIPILSFDGVPGTPTSTVQVRIYQDTLLPADELLDDDPIALREIEQATGVSINSPDPMDRLLVASFGRIMAAENRTGFVSPRRGSAIDLSGVGGEDQDEAPSHHATVSVDDLLPELPETTTSVPEAHSAAPPPAPGDDHATPVVQADGADQPAWLKALAAEWPKSNPIIRLVAVVWLWMRDQPDAENLVQVHGTELRICVHWFEERMRGRLLNDLYSRKLDASIITTNWPSLGLNITVRRLVVSTNGSEPFGVVRGNARDEIVKFGGPQS